MARLPKRAVELDDIIASEMLGDDADVVALILKIHLALEATAGVIAETGWCLLCEAAFCLQEQGGRDIFSGQR